MRNTTRTPLVSAFYVNLLLETAGRFGIAAETLLVDTGLDATLLRQPDQRIDYHAFDALIQRAIELTGEPGLGFLMGMQMKVSNHGLLGYAAMVSNTVREALHLAQRYIEIQTATIKLDMIEVDGEAVLYFDERQAEFPLSETIIAFLMIGFSKMGEALTGRAFQGHAEVTFPRPDYFDRFETQLKGPVLFGRPRNALFFTSQGLDLPLLMADPVAQRLSEEQCKRNLTEIQGSRTFGQLIRDMIVDEDQHFSTLDEVAAKLHMTARTLQRYLARESLSFHDLVADMRRQRAQQLLQEGKLSIQEIADVLGYADATNFTRAFKQWTQESPREYQQRIKAVR